MHTLHLIVRRAALAAVAIATTACAARHPVASAPAPAPADAAPALVTDRPDYTESPVAVPLGSVQLEAGATIDRTAGVLSSSTGEMLLRIGIVRHAEARLGFNSYVRTLGDASPDQRIAGLEDAAIGVKLDLIGESAHRFVPVTGLLLGTTLATGSTALRSSGLTPEAKLALGWTLSPRWEMTTNLNVASAPCVDAACAGRRRLVERAMSLSFGHELSSRLGAYAEAYGGRPTVGAAWQYANVGVTISLAELLQLDVRTGAGLGSTRGDYFTGLGVSRRF